MSNDKKTMKSAKKSGKTTKKERTLVWEYILKNDMGIGYYNAQELSHKGFNVLKPLPLREGQPD